MHSDGMLSTRRRVYIKKKVYIGLKDFNALKSLISEEHFQEMKHEHSK